MKLHIWINFYVASLLLASLTGCDTKIGEGYPANSSSSSSSGSTTTTVTSTLSFPVAAAINTFYQQVNNFTIAGQGANTALVNFTPITSPAAGFNAVAAANFSTVSEVLTLSNASGVISTSTQNLYIYNGAKPGTIANTTLGTADLNTGNYMVAANQQALPANSNVGQSGQLLTGIIYTPTATTYATIVENWALMADTATTAWLCLNVNETLTGATSSIPNSNCFKIDAIGKVLAVKLNLSVPLYTGSVPLGYSSTGQMTFQ